MKKLSIKKLLSIFLVVLIQLVFLSTPDAHAYSNPASVDLLTVDDFAALAKTLISSPTGPTTLNDGDLGIDSPGTCTGFASPCTASGNGTISNGAIQYQNAPALQGQTDATAVVTNLNGRTADTTIAGGLLNGLTLTQGVYDVPATATNLTGDLTLSGDSSSIFIFRATSDFITANTARVLLTGGVQACNVYWTVASQATFDGATEFVGTVFAGTSVDFTAGGATLDGRVIAQTAAITFRNTTVNNTTCSSTSGDSDSDSSSGSNSSGSNVFSADDRCVEVTPSEPQWSLRSATTGGVNLTWSAMGGSKVDIEITNSNGDYVYKYTGIPNDGNEFLPNVAPSQNIRIRVLNECKYGPWLVVSKTPGLPNTGFAPHTNYSGVFEFLDLVHGAL